MLRPAFWLMALVLLGVLIGLGGRWVAAQLW
jgi:hypothetical protein